VAYTAVFSAERAGADVDDLVTILNLALNLTIEAQRLLDTGDVEGSNLLGSEALALVNVARVQAVEREQDALNRSGPLYYLYSSNLLLLVAIDVIVCTVGVVLLRRHFHAPQPSGR
jgi:hypothetical protein